MKRYDSPELILFAALEAKAVLAVTVSDIGNDLENGVGGENLTPNG